MTKIFVLRSLLVAATKLVLVATLVVACGRSTTPTAEISMNSAGSPFPDKNTSSSAILSKNIASFDQRFLFGVANAPAQVEDGLDDSWARHATAPYNYVAAYKNIPNAEKRLNFWSHPETEISLAKNLGIDIYRYGIDWQRLAPQDPKLWCKSAATSGSCRGGIQNAAAWQHYRNEIFDRVEASGMKTMLTLFHHSAPLWFVDNEGWLNKENADKFIDFSKDIIDQIKRDNIQVDYWITLNEPNVFAMHSYVTRMWPGRPPGESGFTPPNLLDFVKLGSLKGRYFKALDNMIYAHREVYHYIHQVFPDAKVSISHNISPFSPSGRKSPFYKIPETIVANQAHFHHNQYILDAIKDSLDYIGLNYYGRERMTLSGVYIDPSLEYMDSGRNIDPDGFLVMLQWVEQRYNKENERKLPLFITENGIADETDALRSSYLIEHLLAVKAAQNSGINILGYIYWTLSDNFEWSDGYCPKFGLLGVDRNDPDLATRIVRNFSLTMFKDIVSSHTITQTQRDAAWDRVQMFKGTPQPMCRALDGVKALDEPNWTIRKYAGNDWRFKI